MSSDVRQTYYLHAHLTPLLPHRHSRPAGVGAHRCVKQALGAAMRVCVDSFRVTWTAPLHSFVPVAAWIIAHTGTKREENFPWRVGETKPTWQKKAVVIWQQKVRPWCAKAPLGAMTHRCGLMIAVMKHPVILD
jgi:hypothetical protein